MTDTKEKILQTALRLFARDGYESVSVSTIAGELGMTKGALYRHYENKRAIFDSIVRRMYAVDAARSAEFAVPEENYEDDPTGYDSVSLESLRQFTLAQFKFWAEDEFASDFRKMLTLEQYRSAEMAELLRRCLTAGPVAYTADIFREMMTRGVLRSGDAQLLALEFYAPLYLLLCLPEGSGNAALLNAHIESFLRRHAPKFDEIKEN